MLFNRCIFLNMVRDFNDAEGFGKGSKARFIFGGVSIFRRFPTEKLIRLGHILKGYCAIL